MSRGNLSIDSSQYSLKKQGKKKLHKLLQYDMIYQQLKMQSLNNSKTSYFFQTYRTCIKNLEVSTQ